MTRRFNAFTLAEVLITLGIIGVVAAMTMPTLINQTNGAQYKAAYKKALSAISQAVTLNVALDDISFADADEGTDATLTEDDKNTIASILNSRMNVVNDGSIPDGYTVDDSALSLPTVNTYLVFNDSIMFAFDNTNKKCTIGSDGGSTVNVCKGYIDVNGQKGPNKVTVCSTESNTKYDTPPSSSSTNTEFDNADECDISSTGPKDVYPVYFYDQTIRPATNAARAVLYGK